MEILSRVRELNRFLQKTPVEPVDFSEVSAVLSDLLECNTYVISRRGKVLGYKLMEGFSCEIIASQEEENEIKISEACNRELWEITEPTAKTEDTGGRCKFFDANCPFDTKVLAIIPTYGANTRMGTLVLGRLERDFDEGELVLGEYGATIVGLETLRSKQEEKDALMRRQIQARVGLNTLSYSEAEAVRLLFERFEGDEQTLVTSEIADEAGLSRSIIVNALSKLESAGVVESQSLGMKGTHIRILNDTFLDELENL